MSTKKDMLEKAALTAEVADAEKETDKFEKKVDMSGLIEKGKKGDLSSSDIDEVMESMDFDLDSLEKLYDAFADNGVALPDELSSGEITEIENEVERFGAG